ncbi:unnamed protein product [Sympodiomycopsis kandeliae]
MTPSSDNVFTFSSPAQDPLPPWPDTSERVLRELYEAYRAAVHTARTEAVGGMTFSGQTTPALAFKFLEFAHRRHPCWVVQSSEQGYVDLWLVGDPTFVHAAVASLIWDLCLSRSPSHHSASFRRLTMHGADPLRKLNIRESGEVRGRRFTIGMSTKEPDDFVCLRSNGNLRSVIEVKFHHESAEELLYETKCWSQQATAPNTTPIINAANTIEIDVDTHTRFRLRQVYPAAFAVILADAADQDGAALTVTLMNASPAFTAKWQRISSTSHLQQSTIVHATQVTVSPRWYVRTIPMEWDDVDPTFDITLEELSATVTDAIRLDSQEMEADYVAATS